MPLRIPRKILITAFVFLSGLALYAYLTFTPILEVSLYTVSGGPVENRVANTRVGAVKA